MRWPWIWSNGLQTDISKNYDPGHDWVPDYAEYIIQPRVKATFGTTSANGVWNVSSGLRIWSGGRCVLLHFYTTSRCPYRMVSKIDCWPKFHPSSQVAPLVILQAIRMIPKQWQVGQVIFEVWRSSWSSKASYWINVMPLKSNSENLKSFSDLTVQKQS